MGDYCDSLPLNFQMNRDMFRYTPSREMLEDYNRTKIKQYNYRVDCPHYAYVRGVCRGNYIKMVAFMKHWKHTDFYSQTRRNQVPVNGILFPIAFFDETEI